MNGKMMFFSVFLLHSFKFFLVPGLPVDIIKGEDENSDTERNHGKMLKGIMPGQHLAVKSYEFTDHPVRVGGDPDSDGQVMA